MAEQSIRSKRFGSFTIDDDDILEFPEGLMGMHARTRFARIPVGPGDNPFEVLVSVDDPEVGFGVADPAQLFADYVVDLTAEREVLQIDSDDECSLRVVLSLEDDPLRTTANLLAPLVINPRTRIGRQLVLSDSRYSTRHPIIAARQPS